MLMVHVSLHDRPVGEPIIHLTTSGTSSHFQHHRSTRSNVLLTRSSLPLSCPGLFVLSSSTLLVTCVGVSGILDRIPEY